MTSRFTIDGSDAAMKAHFPDGAYADVPGLCKVATRVEIEIEPTEEGTLLRVSESRPLALLELQAAELAGGGGAPGGPVMLARS